MELVPKIRKDTSPLDLGNPGGAGMSGCSVFKVLYRLIVRNKGQNGTYQIGEFFGQNLPIWQVFGDFEAMRKGNYISQ